MDAFDFMKAVKKMRNDDIIIACMSPASGGKDFFTDLLFNKQLEEVQHDDVDGIQATRIKHPDPTYNDRIILLNTPNFDTTTSGADIRITSMIKDWLKRSYSNDVSLTGLIYVHNIAETNVLDSLDQNLPLFGELCGWGKLSHVTLVSTMWDKVQPEVGIVREQELRNLFSKAVADNGLSIHRLEKDTPEEAWKIINNLISDRDESESTLLQQKLNALRVQLSKTETGREIYGSFQTLVHDHGEHMQSLLLQIEASDNPVELKKLRREYVGIKESFQTVLKGVKGMGIRPGKMIMNPFFEWRVRARASEINNYLDLTSPAPLTNYPCAFEFDGSTLQSVSEAGQSEDVDRTFQISAILADVCENVATQRFITNLTGDDARCMIDFLNHIVGLEDIKAWNRRLILFLMWKLAESANVFPKYHDDNDALCRPTHLPGENYSLDDEWRTGRTVKVDFQRVFGLFDTIKAQERPYDEVKSPKWSRQTTSPALSHSTDNHMALSASSAEPSVEFLSSVSTAHNIQDLSLVSYPEGIRGPNLGLNGHVQNGKFRYDRDFLLQFMEICKAKPVGLLPMEQLGMEAVHKTPISKNRFLSQTTTIANEKNTQYTSHRSPPKSPELPTVNTLHGPLLSGERLTDINYYLPTGGTQSPATSGSEDWFSPTEEDMGPQTPELPESTIDNSRMPFMLRDTPELKNKKRVLKNAVAAPSTMAQIHETAATGKTAQEEEYSQRQTRVRSSKRGDFWRAPSTASPEGWTVAGNLKTAKPPSKIALSNFGKINKSPPTIFGPGSVFAGKKDKRESLFRAN